MDITAKIQSAAAYLLSQTQLRPTIGMILGSAKEAGIELQQVVYAMYSGPNYEAPAEIRMFRIMGADAVGMSTVPKALVA